jgi:hypothetical protein
VRAVLAILLTLLPVGIGATLIAQGLRGRRAPWPWLAGLGVSTVPAFYMAAVKLCGSVAGTCPSADTVSDSRRAIVTLVLFAIAAVLMWVPRFPARDDVFAGLVLLGELWLLYVLLALDELPAAIMVIALVVLGASYEAGRLRTRREAGSAAA